MASQFIIRPYFYFVLMGIVDELCVFLPDASQQSVHCQGLEVVAWCKDESVSSRSVSPVLSKAVSFVHAKLSAVAGELALMLD